MGFFLLLLLLMSKNDGGGAAPPPFPQPQPVPPPVPQPQGVPPPSTSPAPPAPSVPSSGATYTIAEGDTPFGIAQRFTGQGSRHKELLPPNPSLKVVNTRDADGNIIATHYVPFNPGQVLNVPPSWPASPAS